MLADRALEAGCPIVYVNLVGGQDELVFDGASLVVDDRGGGGHPGRRSSSRRLFVTDLEVPTAPRRLPPAPAASSTCPAAAAAGARRGRAGARRCSAPEREVYEALVLGTRDYVTKNGFGDVVIGLSGGVDSSIVATIAVDALGPERVHGVLMPSRYSSDHSITDAERLADNLGIDRRVIAIEPAFTAFSEMLAPSFDGREPDLTEENLQSRIRGVTLMALSNKFGWLVLTTGNKSESAVGYSTLYGDTAGGFAVIKDVPKLLVYRLCRDRNDRAGRELIPEAVLDQAAVGRAAPRPARRPEPAALRGARPDHRGLRRARPHRRRAHRGRLRPGARAAHRAPHRPGRVQAPPDPARACGSPPRPSARTAASPSPTATAALTMAGFHAGRSWEAVGREASRPRPGSRAGGRPRSRWGSPELGVERGTPGRR